IRDPATTPIAYPPSATSERTALRTAPRPIATPRSTRLPVITAVSTSSTRNATASTAPAANVSAIRSASRRLSSDIAGGCELVDHLGERREVVDDARRRGLEPLPVTIDEDGAEAERGRGA